MSRLNLSLVRSAALVAVVVFSCSLGVAAEQSFDNEVAQTTMNSAGVSWRPAISYESAVLTVSGPDDLSLRRDFAGKDPLVFLVNDRDQKALEDGEYTWEMRFTPVLDPLVKKALVDARESGDSGALEGFMKQGLLPTEPLVVSGYFRVKGGLIIGNETEASTRQAGGRVEASGPRGAVDTDSGVPTKDQVILDDLIVDGSICVGMDCVNGESFGFDTLRLKENNLRIRAVDTSSTSSFPSRDWQITFNDSANGGANKFSIDDIDGGRTPFTLEAGAPSHSLYVDDGGRVGFGTSTPVVDLHVKSGNTPTLRLEQDGSSGFTPQTWDVAGNEANFFIRDATNGSKLPFKIKPNAPTSSIFIEGSTGDIGFGTESPSASLDIVAASGVHAEVELEAGGQVWKWRANHVNGQLSVNDATGSKAPFKIKAGAANNSIVIAASGSVGINTNSPDASAALDVAGPIYQSGSLLHADYVFDEGYQLESIEEHQTQMWREGRLPSVPGRTVNDQGQEYVEIGAHRRGILEELEKAHIYIGELHETIKALERRIEKLEIPSD